MRPRCYNRPPVRDSVEVQDGWTSDGRRNMISIKHFSEDRCAIHDGVGIGPRNENYPTAHGFACEGCRWNPNEKTQ